MKEDKSSLFIIVSAMLFLLIVSINFLGEQSSFPEPQNAQFTKIDRPQSRLIATLPVLSNSSGLSDLKIGRLGGGEKLIVTLDTSSSGSPTSDITVWIVNPDGSIASGPNKPPGPRTLSSGFAILNQREKGLLIRGNPSFFGGSDEVFIYRTNERGETTNTWRFQSPKGGKGVVVADLENDGEAEAIFTSAKDLFVINSQTGALKPGFPVNIIPYGSSCNPNCPTTSITTTPTIADFHNEESLDIIVVADKIIHAINNEGREIPAWPIFSPTISNTQPSTFSNPITSKDIYPEDSGDKVVVIERGYMAEYGGVVNIVHVLDQNGYLSTSFPQISRSYQSVQLFTSAGDLNNDGRSEIIANLDGLLHAYEIMSDRTIQNLRGWPRIIRTESTPLIVNPHGTNGVHSVIFKSTSDTTIIEAVTGTGQRAKGFPISTGVSYLVSPLIFQDLGNTHPNLFYGTFQNQGSGGILRIFNYIPSEEGRFSSHTPNSWPLEGADPQNTRRAR